MSISRWQARRTAACSAVMAVVCFCQAALPARVCAESKPPTPRSPAPTAARGLAGAGAGTAFVLGASEAGRMLKNAGSLPGTAARTPTRPSPSGRGAALLPPPLRVSMVDKGGPASTWEYSATATVRRGRLAARESPWRIAIFNTIVASSTLILEVADVVLRLALFAARALRLALYAVGLKAATTGLLRRLARGIPGPRRRVVIVGASFGGLACARMLRRDFDVTIVDQHDWFEYTPGILRLFVKPEHLESLSASLHGISGVKFVHGKVDRLGASSVRVRAAEGVEVSEAERLFGSKLPFDYAVVACGSSYAAGIKAGPSTPSLHQRRSFWFAQAQRVAAAKTVVIVGGGPVGVELAAEVAVFFPSTKVVLVHSGQRLVSDFAHPVADHSLAWLRKHSVDVLLGHRCEEMPHADTLRMDAPTALRSDRPSPCASSLLVRGAEHPEGLRIDADLVFWCRGGPPCSDGIRPPAQDAGAVQGAAPTSVEDDWSRSGGESGGESGGALPLSPDATICVDSLLQVQGRENVFAVGDVMSVGTARDERLGHTAEVQARVAAHNIRHRAIHHDASLLTHAQRHHSREPSRHTREYHMREYRPTEESQMYCVSLGPYNGSARVGPLIVHGLCAALMKWGIEWVKVAQARERPIGKLIWSIVDFVTARTVDLTRAPLAYAATATPGTGS